jgi:hypothetical protein
MSLNESHLSLTSVYSRLENTEFFIKATGQPYRVINNWDSKNFLSDTRLNPQGWRKFNWFELTWVRLIAEMRLFGLGLDVIAKVKEQLFIYENGAVWNLFEGTVMRCLSEDQTIFILINAEGKTKISAGLEGLWAESLVIIPLQPIIEKVLDEEEQLAAKVAAESSLDTELQQAIRFVRDADFEKIILSFYSDRPIIHRKGEDDEVRKSILETLPGGQFKRIMILRKGGKVFAVDRPPQD